MPIENFIAGDELRAREAAYFEWRQRYEQQPNAACKYLQRLQKVHHQRCWDQPAGHTTRRRWVNRRLSQSGGEGLDPGDYLTVEPPALLQTFMVHSMLYEPTLQVVPHSLVEQLSDVAVGVLPTCTVNAGVMKVLGGKIITLDMGLFQVLSHYLETYARVEAAARAGQVDLPRMKSFFRTSLQVAIDYYAKRGDAGFFLPPETDPAGPEILAETMFRALCCELFVLCHELAHLAKGHLDDQRVDAFRFAGEIGEFPEAIYSHHQQQEFEADVVGYQIYRAALRCRPWLRSVGDARAESECFHLFRLLHLVEMNVPGFRDITTHPDAFERVKTLAAFIVSEKLEAGLTMEQIKDDPVVKEVDSIAGLMKTTPNLT